MKSPAKFNDKARRQMVKNAIERDAEARLVAIENRLIALERPVGSIAPGTIMGNFVHPYDVGYFTMGKRR